MQWSFDIVEVFAFSMSPLELILRGSLMYWFLFLIFRFVIRRDLGSVGIGDVLVLVIIADASQNAMAGEYKSLADGLVLVSTLVVWNLLLDWLSFRSASFRRFAQPSALCMVRNGRLLRRAMREEMLSETELMSQLRENGVDDLSQVKAAYMEPNGNLSVIKYPSA